MAKVFGSRIWMHEKYSLSMQGLRLARFIANISVERYKQYILPAIRLIIP